MRNSIKRWRRGLIACATKRVWSVTMSWTRSLLSRLRRQQGSSSWSQRTNPLSRHRPLPQHKTRERRRVVTSFLLKMSKDDLCVICRDPVSSSSLVYACSVCSVVIHAECQRQQDEHLLQQEGPVRSWTPLLCALGHPLTGELEKRSVVECVWWTTSLFPMQWEPEHLEGRIIFWFLRRVFLVLFWHILVYGLLPYVILLAHYILFVGSWIACLFQESELTQQRAKQAEYAMAQLFNLVFLATSAYFFLVFLTGRWLYCGPGYVLKYRTKKH